MKPLSSRLCKLMPSTQLLWYCPFKTMHVENVLRQNVPRTKHCKGQKVPRDKTSHGQNIPRVAYYLIQYGQEKGMAEPNLPKIGLTLSINWVHWCGPLPNMQYVVQFICNSCRQNVFLKIWGRFVPWDVISFRTFCPWNVLSLGKSCTFDLKMSGDLMSVGRFVPWNVFS